MCKDKKEIKNINSKKRGFSLVELLAVIVILAILLIIGVPTVLNSMVAAKKKGFKEFAQRTTIEAQKTYLKDSESEEIGTCILYSITDDIGLNNTGDFKGYVLIKDYNDETRDNDIYITLNDKDYMIYAAELTKLDNNEIEIYDKNSQYLSKENLLSIANCRDYNVKEETEYVNRVTEIKEDAKSSTPEAIPEPVTEPVQDNLYT